jgi:hypothetical protein
MRLLFAGVLAIAFAKAPVLGKPVKVLGKPSFLVSSFRVQNFHDRVKVENVRKTNLGDRNLWGEVSFSDGAIYEGTFDNNSLQSGHGTHSFVNDAELLHKCDWRDVRQQHSSRLKLSTNRTDFQSKNEQGVSVDRARRQAGGARHHQAIADKDAEIAHLTGTLVSGDYEMPHGFGTIVLANNNSTTRDSSWPTYTGQLKYGSAHGKGTAIESGYMYSGFWFYGERLTWSPFEIRLENGTILEGNSYENKWYCYTSAVAGILLFRMGWYSDAVCYILSALSIPMIVLPPAVIVLTCCTLAFVCEVTLLAKDPTISYCGLEVHKHKHVSRRTNSLWGGLEVTHCARCLSAAEGSGSLEVELLPF